MYLKGLISCKVYFLTNRLLESLGSQQRQQSSEPMVHENHLHLSGASTLGGRRYVILVRGGGVICQGSAIGALIKTQVAIEIVTERHRQCSISWLQ